MCLVKVTDFPRNGLTNVRVSSQARLLLGDRACVRERESVCVCVRGCLCGVCGCFGVCDFCFKQERSLVRHIQMKRYVMPNHPELDNVVCCINGVISCAPFQEKQTAEACGSKHHQRSVFGKIMNI